MRAVIVLGGVLSMGTSLAACNQHPFPAAVIVTAPAECREGEIVPLRFEVKDAAGQTLDAGIQWQIDPATNGAIEGSSLRCSKEGTISVTAIAGSAKATRSVTVVSPLLATWTRRGGDKDGLTVKVEPSAEGLLGYVVGSPGEAAIPHVAHSVSSYAVNRLWDSRYGYVSPEFILKCLRQQWAPGLKKWKGVRRLTETKWTLSDLSKAVSVGQHCNPITGQCYPPVCGAGKTGFEDDLELTLVDPTHIEIRDSTSDADTIQRWERADLTALGDAGAPDAGVPDAGVPDADASGHVGPVTANKPPPSAAPKSAAPDTETTYCPNGLKANEWHFGCACGDLFAPGGATIQAPGPKRCNPEYPTSNGSACIYRCEPKAPHPNHNN